jgi:hypothetical protein
MKQGLLEKTTQEVKRDGKLPKEFTLHVRHKVPHGVDHKVSESGTDREDSGADEGTDPANMRKE